MSTLFGYTLAVDAAQLLLLGTLTLGCLIAAHLVARRRRRLLVSTVEVWHRPQRAPRTFLGWRIQRWLLFLLHVSIALLLIVTLADPRPDPAGANRRSVALLIDVSTSMAAGPPGNTRLDRARAEASAVIQALDTQDAVMVAGFARQMDLECPLTRDRDAVADALARLEVDNQTDDLPTAVGQAADLLRGHSRAAIVVIGDRPAETRDLPELRHQAGLPIEYRTVGIPARNVGIAGFSLQRAGADPSRLEARLTLQASGAEPVRATFDLLSLPSRRRIEGGTVPIPASGSASIQRILPTGTEGTVAAVLREPSPGSSNSLGLDDRAEAVVPTLQRRTVLLVSTGNHYLEKALASLGRGVVTDQIRPDELARRPPDWSQHDVVIFDGVAPAPAPRLGRYLYLDPSGPGSPFPSLGQLRDPVPTDSRRDHPLLRQVALADLNIREARRLTVTRGDEVVVAALGLPLIVARRDGGLRIVALAFDLRRSDLPLRPTLPLLLANTLDWLTDGVRPRIDSTEAAVVHPEESDTMLGGISDPQPGPASRPARSRSRLRLHPADLALFLAFALGLLEWWAHQRRWAS